MGDTTLTGKRNLSLSEIVSGLNTDQTAKQQYVSHIVQQLRALKESRDPVIPRELVLGVLFYTLLAQHYANGNFAQLYGNGSNGNGQSSPYLQ